MKTYIFSVRDRATDQFGSPMFMLSKGQAIRSFADEINKKNPENMLCNHPEDYDLYLLGSWESDDGQFETHAPQQVAIGKDLVIK